MNIMYDGVIETMNADFKLDVQSPDYLKWAWRNRTRRPQAQATRGKPDARSGGMDRLSNGQVVREPGFSRRKIRAMRRDWGAKLRKRAKNWIRTSSGGWEVRR